MKKLSWKKWKYAPYLVPWNGATALGMSLVLIFQWKSSFPGHDNVLFWSADDTLRSIFRKLSSTQRIKQIAPWHSARVWFWSFSEKACSGHDNMSIELVKTNKWCMSFDVNVVAHWWFNLAFKFWSSTRIHITHTGPRLVNEGNNQEKVQLNLVDVASSIHIDSYGQSQAKRDLRTLQIV